MLNLRKLTMPTQHFLLHSTGSPSPIHGRVRRAFHGTCSQNVTRRAENGCNYSECSSSIALMHTNNQLGLLSGGAAGRCLLALEQATRPAVSQNFPTQTRCLHAGAGSHDRRLQFEIGQDTNLCEGERSACGSIHLIVGPMFAGKTTALLSRVEAEASAGRRVALVKSDKDTRYGLASIVSHDGKQMPCWAVSSLANFRSQIGEEEYAKLDLIGIDEAQFLKDLYSFCQAAADYEGKTLIVAGLDGDFQRNKFGSILDLVPLADSVVKLSSLCELCGKPASFTFRKTDNRNKEVIGGTDIYMPVCRQHYFSGKIAMDATRTVLDIHNFIPLQFSNAEKPTHLLHENDQ